MMRNFLAQRFHLVVRRETKDLPIYAIVIAKSGSKLQETVVDKPAATPPSNSGAPKLDAYGFPPPRFPEPGAVMASMQPGRSRMIAKAIPVSTLAERLSYILARPVTDSTGLTGKYDIVLTYSADSAPNGGLRVSNPDANPDNSFVPSGEPVQDLFGAIQAQLGLRLESRRGPVPTVIIEKADRIPTEN